MSRVETHNWVPSVPDVVRILREELDRGHTLLEAMELLSWQFPNVTDDRLNRAFLVLIDFEGREELVPQIQELFAFSDALEELTAAKESRH
jgi:hypothetical protein